MLDFILYDPWASSAVFCISEGKRKLDFCLLISFPIFMMFITLSSVIFWLVLVNFVSVFLMESTCLFLTILLVLC